MATVVRVWMQEDEAAASAWLDAALPDPDLDSAVAEAARLRLRDLQVGEAAAWAVRIEDPEERRASVSRAIRTWLRRDPVAARAWLAEQGIVESALDLAPRGPLHPGSMPALRRSVDETP